MECPPCATPGVCAGPKWAAMSGGVLKRCVMRRWKPHCGAGFRWSEEVSVSAACEWAQLESGWIPSGSKSDVWVWVPVCSSFVVYHGTGGLNPGFQACWASKLYHQATAPTFPNQRLGNGGTQSAVSSVRVTTHSGWQQAWL